ncbi:hypothetical protein GCM10011491_14450 [Brucella endophytica]|uniref:Uncharacterized protein n=1 Tax=Brucella endophytica TaxID=1963359 RepID=A0A916S7B9_9HYPH|nr:hypothetical protein [Brucella endophytica]GGA87810.1 hypothetical protein GCM10011491_14450 [Brucella endophytica]
MSDEKEKKRFVLDLDAISEANKLAPKMKEMQKAIELPQKTLAGPISDIHKIMESQEKLWQKIRFPIDRSILGNSDLWKTLDKIKTPSLFENNNSLLNSRNAIPVAAEIQNPTVEIPNLSPHPAHETNERLEEMESHFSQMLQIMTNGAAIATGIQEQANEFLAKFEKASEDTDKSARQAIRVGLIAIVIAIITPLVQIGYDTFQDHTEEKLEHLTNEVASLRKIEETSIDKLVNELRNQNGDSQIVLQLKSDNEANREILRRIEQALSQLKANSK